MNLADAYRRLGPTGPDGLTGPGLAARREAAGVVHAALGSLANRIVARHRTGLEPEDIAAQVLIFLLRTGPRPAFKGDDQNAERVLRTSIRNRYVSEIRRQKRHATPTDLSDLSGLGSAERRRVDEFAVQARQSEAGQRVQAYLDVLASRVEPEAKRRLRGAAARTRFEESCRELVDLAQGKTDIGTLTAAKQGAVPSAAEERRARNTLHQRHARARRHLIEAIVRLERRGEIAPGKAEGLRLTVARYLTRCQPRERADVNETS